MEMKMTEFEQAEQTRNNENAPKQLSVRQTLFLTLKVLALIAVLSGLLWLGSETVNR